MPTLQEAFAFKKCTYCKKMKGVKDYDLREKGYIVFVNKGVHKKEMYKQRCKECPKRNKKKLSN